MNAHRTMLRTLPAILALAGALSAGTARAYSDDSQTWANGQAVSVQLQVAGRAAPLYLSPQGDARRYVEAFAGRNYAVVLHNNTSSRLGVLIAVDGLNVVSGTRSRLSPDEQMYVLDAYETATIRGWRTSLDDIQKFVFVDEQRSYAERTGQANADMGWIRVQSYREQRPWWQPKPRIAYDQPFRGGRDDARRELSSDAAPAPTAAAPQAESMGEAKSLRKQAAEGTAQNESGGSFPGTGWGDHRNDPVQRVEFVAERRATDTLNFRYEYASGLQALGIYRHRDRLRERDNGELGFAKPPRW